MKAAKRYAYTSTMILGLAAATPIQAQEGSSRIAPESNESAIEEIVVTARRTEENLQDVPVSITALSPTKIERATIRDTFDLQLVAPGMSVAGTSQGGRTNVAISIRGQRNADADAPPGVANYLADVPIFPIEASRSSYDLASIQVLKGPQGTLFGKNTNGGAVVYVPQAPRPEFEGYARARYGNYNDRYLEAMINLPFNEVVTMRVAGNIERRDGFVKNVSGPDIDNLRYHSLRASLLVDPGTGFENTTVFNYIDVKEFGPAYFLADVTPCPSPATRIPSCLYTPANLAQAPYNTLGYTPIAEALALQKQLGLRGASDPTPSVEDSYAFGFSNTTKFLLGDTVIKAILGYHQYRQANLRDFDGIAVDAFQVNYFRLSKQYSAEIQIQRSFGDNAQFIGGGIFTRNTEDPFSSGTSEGLVNYPFNPRSINVINRRSNSAGIFAQFDVKLDSFIKGLSFTAGGRYTWDDLDIRVSRFNDFYLGNTGGVAVPAGQTVVRRCGYTVAADIVDLNTCILKTSSKFRKPSWSLSLNYQPNDAVLLYVTHRHGTKTGGFNATGGNASGFVYQPETLDDIELGFKTQFEVGGMQVRANADVFYNWYKDLQINSVVVTPTSASNLLQNVGVVHLWGGEAELTLMPTRGLELTAGYANLSGEFSRGTVILQNRSTRDLAGVAYRYVPKHQLTLQAAYTHDLGRSLGELMLSGSYSWRSSSNPDLAGLLATEVPGFGILGGRINWKDVAGTPVELSIFGKNLGNKAARLFTTTTNSMVARFFNEPRTYGVELTYRF